MTTDARDVSRLRYLEAASVRGLFPTCAEVNVWNDEDGKLGRLDGIVMDPEARQVQYLVVATGGVLRRRRYLLPFQPTRIDVERHVLCVDADKAELARCEEFDAGAIHPFSDDDLLAALFPKSGNLETRS